MPPAGLGNIWQTLMGASWAATWTGDVALAPRSSRRAALSAPAPTTLVPSYIYIYQIANLNQQTVLPLHRTQENKCHHSPETSSNLVLELHAQKEPSLHSDPVR